VLVLDEPTTGIDPAGRRTVREQIASLAADGATILVTTHDMDEAERIADRVALLAGGELRATGTPAELIEAHGGPPRVIVEFEAADASTVESAVRSLEQAGLRADAGAGRLVVPDVRPEGIGAVVEALATNDLAYDGLEWRRPALEDAYLAIADAESIEHRRSAPVTQAGGAGGGESS